MKNEQIKHNKKTYTIVEILEIKDMIFAVCVNQKYEYCYFKKKTINGRDTYVDYTKLMQILPEYEDAGHANCANMMDAFTEFLNKDKRPKEAVFEKMNEVIEDERFNFEKGSAELSVEYFDTKIRNAFINRQKPTFDDLLRTDKKKNLASLPMQTGFAFGRFAYMLIVAMATIGFMECWTAYSNWKVEGNETNDIMEELLMETEIVHEQDIEELYNVAGDDKTPTANRTSKYGASYWDMMQTPMMNVDFTKLKKQNSDTVGWLYVNNTSINYPFVQTKDNTYYLKRSFDHKKNSAGWLYADYRSDLTNFKNNTVIYGHSRLDQVMFGTLKNVLKKEWYTNPDNHIIKLSTPTENTLWQVFSVYTVKAEAYYLTHNFENDASYQTFLNTIIKRSIHNFEADLDTGDKILTLSTCLNDKGERIVLHAKLVKSQPR